MLHMKGSQSKVFSAACLLLQMVARSSVVVGDKFLEGAHRQNAYQSELPPEFQARFEGTSIYGRQFKPRRKLSKEFERGYIYENESKRYSLQEVGREGQHSSDLDPYGAQFTRRLRLTNTRKRRRQRKKRNKKKSQSSKSFGKHEYAYDYLYYLHTKNRPPHKGQQKSHDNSDEPFYGFPRNIKNCCFTDEQSCEIFTGANNADACPSSDCFCPFYLERQYGHVHGASKEVRCIPSFPSYCQQFGCENGDEDCIFVVQGCCAGWCYSSCSQAEKCDAYNAVLGTAPGDDTCDNFVPIICPDSNQLEFSCENPNLFCDTYLKDKDGNPPDQCQGNCESALAPGGCCGCT